MDERDEGRGPINPAIPVLAILVGALGLVVASRVSEVDPSKRGSAWALFGACVLVGAVATILVDRALAGSDRVRAPQRSTQFALGGLVYALYTTVLQSYPVAIILLVGLTVGILLVYLGLTLLSPSRPACHRD